MGGQNGRITAVALRCNNTRIRRRTSSSHIAGVAIGAGHAGTAEDKESDGKTTSRQTVTDIRSVKSFFVVERLPVGADLNLGLLAVGDHVGYVRDDQAAFGD